MTFTRRPTVDLEVLAARWRPLAEALGAPPLDRDRVVGIVERGDAVGAVLARLAADAIARRRRRRPTVVPGWVAADPLGPRPAWAQPAAWRRLRASEAVRVADVLRRELGLADDAVARLLGVSSRSLRRWRTGTARSVRSRLDGRRRRA